MFFYIILGMGFLGATLHILFDERARDRGSILVILLLYLLPTAIGLMGILGFVGHLFFSDRIAFLIGWPAGNPFQKEIAFANLAFGILGILCIWIRGNFWLATILGQGIFMWGAAGVHLWQIYVYKNYAPDNAGTILYLDILIPLVLLTLWIDLRLTRRRMRRLPHIETTGEGFKGKNLP